MAQVSGLQIGRYRILHRIASGGMADVYLGVAAGEGGFEKEVVIKRISAGLAGDARIGQMFLDEAKLAVGLMHPNIVQVLDVGRISNASQQEYFLVLESVRGRDLWHVLEAHSRERSLLPLDLGLFIGLEITRALDYAHRRTGPDGKSLGIVHRDVSPQNVLISF